MIIETMMTMNKELYHYKNGNYDVSIFSDGSKIRTIPDDIIPSPDFPESIDVKITDYCDAGCSFCHEMSTRKGIHADVDILLSTLEQLPPGIELAIGGGNPISHPNIIEILSTFKNRGLICNITVNQKHLVEDENRDLIFKLIDEDLIKGIGVSYSSDFYLPYIKEISDRTDNMVFHVIMGINPVSDIKKLCEFSNKTCKILCLGYKQFGFGSSYYLKSKKIDDTIYEWYTCLASEFKNSNLVISFDNLAIRQLNLKRFFTDKAWSKFYMGDDFVYTMYIDGVKKQYAPSSTSMNRKSFDEIDLISYFKKNRNSK